MLVAVDIDGTIDADPPAFLSLMQALRAAGHRVVVLTGCGAEQVSPEDITQKKEYLQSLGVGEAYDELCVFGNPTDELKAEWLKAHGADMLIDNAIANVKAASGTCLCLVPWASRVKDK